MSTSSTISHNSHQAQTPMELSYIDTLLPQDLGGLILDLEIDCESDKINKSMIIQLIELYSRGIEYYEALGSKKAQVFKHRMHSFLFKPLIQSILNDKSALFSLRRESIRRVSAEASFSSKEEVKMLIEKSERRAESNRKSLNSWIGSQEQTLSTRINRRKSMSNKSINSEVNFDDFDIESEDLLAKKLLLGVGFETITLKRH